MNGLFRYPNPICWIFTISRMSHTNFIINLYRFIDKNKTFNDYAIYKLLNIIYHKTDAGILFSTTYRNPIYLITSIGLLPKLVV